MGEWLLRENGRSYSAANKGSEERRRGDIYLSWKDEAAAAASLAGATKAQEAAAAAEAAAAQLLLPSFHPGPAAFGGRGATVSATVVLRSGEVLRVALGQGGRRVRPADVLGGGSVAHTTAALKAVNRHPSKWVRSQYVPREDRNHFGMLMRAPLLLSTEQDELVGGLRSEGFFVPEGQFDYNEQTGEWWIPPLLPSVPPPAPPPV